MRKATPDGKNYRKNAVFGHPAGWEGHPFETKGVPSVTKGHPSEAKGVPSVTKGHPSEAKGVPSDTKGHPSETKGHPSETKGVGFLPVKLAGSRAGFHKPVAA